MEVQDRADLLLPLLEDFCTDKNLKSVCTRLQSENVLPKDFLETLPSSSSLSQALVGAFQTCENPNWPERFLECLESTGEKKLVAVFNQILFGLNIQVIWIVTEWKNLLHCSEIFKDIGFFLHGYPWCKNKPELLLEIAYDVLIHGPSSIPDMAIKQMKKTLLNGQQAEIIDSDTVMCLVPILSWEINLDNLKFIAEQFLEYKFISPELHSQIQTIYNDQFNEKHSIVKKLFLEIDQLPSWPDSVVPILTSLAGPLVGHIIDACFKHPDKVMFLWVTQNWKQLQDNKNMVFTAAADYVDAFVLRFCEGRIDWLMQIMHKFLDTPSEVLYAFVMFLVNGLQSLIESPSYSNTQPQLPPKYFGRGRGLAKINQSSLQGSFKLSPLHAREEPMTTFGSMPLYSGVNAYQSLSTNAVASSHQHKDAFHYEDEQFKNKDFKEMDDPFQQFATKRCEQSSSNSDPLPPSPTLEQNEDPNNNVAQTEPSSASTIDQKEDQNNNVPQTEAENHKTDDNNKNELKETSKQNLTNQPTDKGKKSKSSKSSQGKGKGKNKDKQNTLKAKDQGNKQNNSNPKGNMNKEQNTNSVKETQKKAVQDTSTMEEALPDGNSGHEYNLRNNEKKRFKESACMNPYQCGVESHIEINDSEQSVEFRVVIDQEAKALLGSWELYVYVDNLRSFFQLHKDEALGSDCFHTVVVFHKAVKSVIYKYLLHKDGVKDKWENLPQSMYNEIVNRKLEVYNIKSPVVTFDVSCIEHFLDGRPASLSSLYARDMVDHLPPMDSIHTTEEECGKLIPYTAFQLRISKWWESVKQPVAFTSIYATCSKETSCKSLLQSFVKKVCKGGNPAQLVLAHLAIAQTVSEYQIVFLANDEEFYQNICQGLSLGKLKVSDYKVLYDIIIDSDTAKRLETTEVLTDVIKKSSNSVDCLLVLPLLYIIENNGNSAINKTTLKQCLQGLKCLQLGWSLKHKRPSKLVACSIKENVKNFPFIGKVFQGALGWKETCELIKDDPQFQKVFDAHLILQSFCSLNYFDIEYFDQHEIIRDWIHEKICAKILTENSSKTEKKKHTLCDMLSEFLEKLSSVYYKGHSVQVMLWCLSMLLLSKKADMEQIKKSLNSWITNNEYNRHNLDIKFWSQLFELNVSYEQNQLIWKCTVHSLFKITLLKKLHANYEDVLKLFEESKLNDLPNKEVESCLSDALYDFINEISKNKRWYIIDRFWKNSFSTIVSVITKIFLMEWKKYVEQPLSFRAIKFFQWSFANEPTKKKKLTSEIVAIMDTIESSINEVYVQLSPGSITVCDLEAILDDEISFCSGITALAVSKTLKFEATLKEYLDQRRLEFQAVSRFKTNLRTFTELCALHLDGFCNFKWLIEDISYMKWQEVFNCSKKLDAHSTVNDGIVLYGLSDKQKNAIEEICNCRIIGNINISSEWKLMCMGAVDKIQNNEVNENHGKLLSIDEVITFIWGPMKEKFCALKNSITKGTILLDDVEKMLLSCEEKSAATQFVKALFLFPDYNYEENSCDIKPDLALPDTSDDDLDLEDVLANGLELVETTKEYATSDIDPAITDLQTQEVMQLRIEQISNYLLLKDKKRNISAFVKLKDCLQLKGDFQYFDVVMNETNLESGKKLMSITNSIITAGKMFEDIKPEHSEFIEKFIEHAELVAWVKDNMKDRSEVKVLSDLAMISAGESVQDVDKVSCFLSAVMGFSPFLFDLNNDSGLEDVISALINIWEHKQRDAKFVQNWEATAGCFEWLKGIKESHGSVEKSSLLKVQSINHSSAYFIGHSCKIPSLWDSVKLVISDTANTDEQSSMTLRDLQELQSRLMLIEDKKLKDVQDFIENLSIVENLAKAYVNLKQSGCLLFNNWTMEIKTSKDITDSENPMEMSMTIRFDDNSSPIFCRENVRPELKNITGVMEHVLEKWQKNLSEMRSTFYYMNHYNIHQLTFLCHELANAVTSKDLPDQVYALLSVIKNDICFAEVAECLGTSSQEQTEADEEIETDPIAPNTSEEDTKRRFVKNLMHEDISETTAKAGVQAAEKLEYDDIYMWCLENAFNDDLVEPLAVDFDKEMGLSSELVYIPTMESIVKDKSNLTLQEVIRKISDEETTDEFRASVMIKTVCQRYLEESSKTSLCDCISLECLGIFLNKISHLRDEKSVPKRNLPEHMMNNVNLVICPKEETLTTLVSLYMESHNQPLPTASEVLICTNSTTKDEVELLLRRAVSDGSNMGKRVYSLAKSEVLSFEISNALEVTLSQLQRDIKTNFKLVIFCSSNQHYVASLFNEYKVDYSNRFSDKDIKSYLDEKLNTDVKSRSDQTFIKLILSQRAGMGKSLYILKLKKKLQKQCNTTVRFLEKDCNLDEVMVALRNNCCKQADPHFIHLDVTPAVEKTVNHFLFNLVILGSFTNSTGEIWRRNQTHIYCVEYAAVAKRTPLDNLLMLLPTTTCLSPKEILNQAQTDAKFIKMDDQEFRSDTFQRPYQYLLRYSKNENLDKFKYISPQGTPQECLETFLRFCSVSDPTWLEVKHFASFLNCQLTDCEESFFCNEALVGTDSGLSGFKNFVVRFMIRMSQDFATPSLKESEPMSSMSNIDIFELHQLRRSWEENVHPYLFFNEDRMSMSFINFQINSNGDLLASRNRTTLERAVMQPSLYRGLRVQQVNLNQNFDDLSSSQKLETLFNVFGITGPLINPDPSYELTTDNVLKILAIHMRFRCNIPVIIMGETGCGKTRMVEFMSKLKAVGKPNVNNMLVVKVHGGITVSHIQDRVREAVELAKLNKDKHGIETLLFLDEANTTEAIFAIKEFVCDGSICGESIENSGLNIVAACNPYRRHTKEAIEKMENAGLGFKVKTDETSDKLGEIPMRCLVYRVIALPPSMHSLVWDFGQLNDLAERVYIQQMVNHLSESSNTYSSSNLDRKMMIQLLCESQSYMRKNREECLFVSLRDVERCLLSFQWFYKNWNWIENEMDKEIKQDGTSPSVRRISKTCRCLIQAIGMCYYVTLSEREDYLTNIAECLTSSNLLISTVDLKNEIETCQAVFLNAISLGEDIAANEALRENVFMIVMCCEMRIPLFLIGKPGSSKSLAKTIVTDAMQGLSSQQHVYQKLKQIHVLSFQCSPVTDAIGIESVFKQCSKLQAQQDHEKFVAVVVLDEIGLAEDSPKMPLKVLHPLLESGMIDGELKTNSGLNSSDFGTTNRVGFVGISNWALDPAKMNRGIFVYRGSPNEADLKLTAKGIFTDETTEFKEVTKIVDAATTSYVDIYGRHREEFFGLRDYYGLLKMIYSFACKQDDTLSYYDVYYSVLRNFSGSKHDCLQTFQKHFASIWPAETLPLISLKVMIQDNLKLDSSCESRYLLLMTNHFAVVSVLGNITNNAEVEIIFGSSFPQDDNYTEKCRNINRIKMCMEAGSTVVLLNLKDLYESLYDALNQHYVTFAGQRYVDLGLGGHRVKCRVHKNFRLIVMEDMSVVYNEYPIPLINRLEKHIFTTKSLLDSDQQTVSDRVNTWIKNFSSISFPVYGGSNIDFSCHDAFVGYMEDTAGSAVLAVPNDVEKVERAKLLLLNTATCDSLLRLENSKISKESQKWQDKYFKEQCHDNLYMLLKSLLEKDTTTLLLLDVTSFSQMLTDTDRQILEQSLSLNKNSVFLITLQQFKTAEDFMKKIELFLSDASQSSEDQHTYILLVQCPQAHTSSNLIACAKYSIRNLLHTKNEILQHSKVLIAFIYSVERHSDSNQVKTYISNDSVTVYVDELRIINCNLGAVSELRHVSLGKLFRRGYEAMLEMDLHSESNSVYLTDFLINLHQLLCNSLSLAVSKLQNNDDNNKRFNNLFSVFSSKSNSNLFFNEFVRRCALQVVNVVETKDMLSWPGSSWVDRQSRSQDALIEGGSLTKTLWLYLKKITSTALAYIFSEVDSDQNLDILLNEKTDRLSIHLKNLWLELFLDKAICNFSWLQKLDAMQNFLVRGTNDFTNKFPFGRSLVQFFQRQWEISNHFEPNEQKKLFHSKLKNNILNLTLEKSCSSSPLEVLKCFAHDVVCVLYKPGSDKSEEIQFIVEVLMEITKNLQKESHDDVVNASSNIAVIFVLFQTHLREFINISEIFSFLPELLSEKNIKEWVNIQKKSQGIQVHLNILETALEYIKSISDDVSTIDDFNKWTKLLNKIRNSAEAILLHSYNAKIEQLWKALGFGALFLQQIMPQGLTEEIHKGHIEILLPLSKRLWKGALKSGLDKERFLNIVITTLRGCTDQIRLKYLVEWKDIKCMVCKQKKVEKPFILPCKHFMCFKCTPIVASDRKCPHCRVPFSKDCIIEPTKLTPDQQEKIDSLSASCTSFFLEYLSTLCFPAPGTNTNIAPTKNITDALHKLVICDSATKELSPLTTSVFDETPTIRSFILQLLLRYDTKLIQLELENHFSNFEDVLSDKQDLMFIYIRCIEDSLQAKKEKPGSVLLILQEQLESLPNLSQVKQLELTANFRFLLFESLGLLFSVLNGDKPDFINDLTAFIKTIDNPVVNNYLVKLLCRRYGLDMFSKLVNHPLLNVLIPDYLRTDITEILSMKVVVGKNVAVTNKYLLEMSDDSSHPTPSLLELLNESADSTVQVLLSILTWTFSNKFKDGSFEEAYLQCIGDNLNQNKRNVALFYDTLLNLKYQCISTQANMPNFCGELILATCLTICSCQNTLLSDFYNLLLHPNEMAHSFLPTMPQSNYFEVKHIVSQWIEKYNKAPKAYLCPNNHLYFIGDCTNPAKSDLLCPDCKQPIGGIEEGKLKDGNKAGEITEASQAGYKIVNMAQKETTDVTPERSCSRLTVAILRFFLHSTLLLANKESVSRLLGMDSPHVDLYLLSCLMANLKQVSKCLGKSIEDAALLIHQVLNHIRQQDRLSLRSYQNMGFTSMDNRKKWEIDFQQLYLAPVLANADQMIDKARKLILSSKKQNDLERLVFEIPAEGNFDDVLNTESDIVPWDHPSLWNYHVNITVNNLRQALEGKVSTTADEGYIIKHALQSTNLLLIRHLTLVLEIQSEVVQKLKGKAEEQDVENITIEDFQKQNDCIVSNEKFLAYIDVWNEIKDTLKLRSSALCRKGMFENDMNMQSSILICLPCETGGGRAALELTLYLVEEQNSFLHMCKDVLKPPPEFKEVSLLQVSPHDLICLESENDLLPYILANAQYETSSGATGTKHHIVYRLAALEKQIVERFILPKKLLDPLSVPCMEYLYDQGLETAYNAVKENVKQEKSSLKIEQKLEEIKSRAHLSEICEVVRTLLLIIKHLAKMPSDSNKHICIFAKEDLMLPKDEYELIPPAGKLSHVLSLFEWFSCQKARKKALAKQNLYNNIDLKIHEEMENTVPAINLLKQIDVETLQIELNAFLLLKSDCNPDVSLKEYLEAFVDERDGNSDWTAQIPDEILLKHSVHLFQLSVIGV